MKKIDLKQVLLYLIIAFVIVSIWNDPQQSAERAGDFLGSVGSWFVDLIDKSSSFFKGLTGNDGTTTTTTLPG